MSKKIFYVYFLKQKTNLIPIFPDLLQLIPAAGMFDLLMFIVPLLGKFEVPMLFGAIVRRHLRQPVVFFGLFLQLVFLEFGFALFVDFVHVGHGLENFKNKT